MIQTWKTRLKRLIFSLLRRVRLLALANDAKCSVTSSGTSTGDSQVIPIRTAQWKPKVHLFHWAQRQARWNFVPSLPLTPPGLILMLKYFLFANDVAQLQSACLNMHGGKERLLWRCRSITVVFAPALRSITADPRHVRRVAWICLILLCSARGARVSEYRQVHVVCENSDTSFSHPSFSHYIH